ncbi:MAG: HAMP domain-containing histidine kinase [Bacteroidales bacterium]|nr:HAMP domain-containing histidine kinase [Bacteroidales bacterium]
MKKKVFVNKRTTWILLVITTVLALVSLLLINSMIGRVRESEEEKIKLWASAISQKSEMMHHTEQFFKQAELDERRKLQLYANVLQSFNESDQQGNLSFSLAYVNYIVDSCKTPIIITYDDSTIVIPKEMKGRKLRGSLMQEFSEHEPVHYTVWGMQMSLYYKETQVYSDLRTVLEGYSQDFLSEITNNMVLVPVIVMDSTRERVLSSGNVDTSLLSNPASLASMLDRMARQNNPIPVSLANGEMAFVYYRDTPMLVSLSRMPLLYLFIALVLIVVSYNLFRTTKSDEMNQVWVGLAKETAHQLGTPISSMMAWIEYLKGKTFTETYVAEMQKDLTRLETIAHRFSKIGSTPELTETDVCEVVENTLSYLKPRTSHKVKFEYSHPDEPLMVALNGYLFEWVIENLCKNAVDAMNGGGTISINVSADTKYVYIDVSDTGKGIPQAAQSRIFESGFTTKQRGWGLGLSLARRIVNEYHRGRIVLKYSVEGQGTVFRITLRRVESRGAGERRIRFLGGR